MIYQMNIYPNNQNIKNEIVIDNLPGEYIPKTKVTKEMMNKLFIVLEELQPL